MVEMAVRILVTGMQGESVQEAVADRLHGILSKALKSAKPVQEGIVSAVRSHF